MKRKIIIYQVFTRLFGNRNTTRVPNGTLRVNGTGKMSDFDAERLRRIHGMGFTHVWYTGVIRHATATDYSKHGIPRQHPSVVKGVAGSPYAITDYYDIDPDLADDIDQRMSEFQQLVERTHQAGMKVIIDFVPNHVAREYHSIMKPEGVRDLGEDDDTGKHFSPTNNFYYCPGQPFVSPVQPKEGEEPYVENPAKCTGNDRFDNCPGRNDWYETVKLNYGIDYCDAGGRSYHFDPVPNTWVKMTDILLYWASKDIDGFRCDMAEMVPPAFWAYATRIVKERYPRIVFIGEVYDTNQYRTYIQSGFDYLYDKVGMYDCLRDVICDRRPASSITYYWQHVEFGERGMDAEGFSGRDGRTTIFDYWCVDTIRRGYFDRRHLSQDEMHLQLKYQQILHIANREAAVREGEFFDLMYVNPQTWKFNPRHEYAFLRKFEDEVLLIVANFGPDRVNTSVNIPAHAFDFLGLPEKEVRAIDLLTGQEMNIELKKDGAVDMDLRPYTGRIYKFSIKMEETPYLLNVHNKDEFPPAHTAEHLLNQVMIRMVASAHAMRISNERKARSTITSTISRRGRRRRRSATR